MGYVLNETNTDVEFILVVVVTLLYNDEVI